MSQVFDPSFPAPCPAPFNMAEYVLRAGLEMPEKTALEVLGGAQFSHGSIRTHVTKLAGGLVGLGLPDGAKVMIRLGNRVEFPILYLACIWAGLIPVPTSAQLNENEITKIADELKPDLIVAEPGIACPASAARSLNLHDLNQLQSSRPCPPVMGDPERLAYIIFTSGTSGKPKGVCHAHRAIWARRMMFDGWYGLQKTDRVLHAGAFNWSYTMGTGLMDPWTLGATALIPPEGMQMTDLASEISTSEATIFAAAPGVYRQVLKSKDLLPTGTLRHGLSAGEALAPSLRSKWQAQMGCDIHEALGMSECSTFISGSPHDPAQDGTSGKAQLGRKIDVHDSDGNTAKPDEAGKLVVHKSDPGLMIGYLNAKEPVAEWFQTGDTVSMSGDGSICYLGRNDDIITAGGFRISPLDVENAFASFPNAIECAVTQVKLNAETNLIALFYSAITPINEKDLRAHAQRMLAPYKQPRLYIARASLPKGANGKLNRSILRNEFEADQ